jgi:hypothetical protein
MSPEFPHKDKLVQMAEIFPAVVKKRLEENISKD